MMLDARPSLKEQLVGNLDAASRGSRKKGEWHQGRAPMGSPKGLAFFDGGWADTYHGDASDRANTQQCPVAGKRRETRNGRRYDNVTSDLFDIARQ